MSNYLLQQILNGVQLGTIYALIALGYSMVYGTIKLINFAHADIFMVGAYTAFFALSFYSGTSGMIPFTVCLWVSILAGYAVFAEFGGRIPFLPAALKNIEARLKKASSIQERAFCRIVYGGLEFFGIAGFSAVILPILYYSSGFLFRQNLGIFLFPLVILYVMMVCGLLGLAMEKIAYRPLREKPRLSALITALGVSLFLENFCSLDMVFSSKYRHFPELIKKTGVIHFGSTDLIISNLFLLNLSVAGALLLGLWVLVEKTRVGKQMRAVAYDKKTAALMGINVDRIIALTFVIGPMLAGVSGVLFAMNYGILQSPFLGFFPGIKAFVAAVLGGIGSLPGAVLGGLILGTTEVFANSVDSNLGFAAAFIVLILILLVRPSGLLGKSEQEKV